MPSSSLRALVRLGGDPRTHLQGRRMAGRGPGHGVESVRRPAHQHGSSHVAAWTIPTNEELMIARHTERLLAH